VLLALALDFWKLEVVVVLLSSVLIGPHLALHVMVRQHGVVQGHTAFGSVALSLVLVVIHAVDVHNSFIILARVTLDLNQA
jgi:hypothetical protein